MGGPCAGKNRTRSPTERPATALNGQNGDVLASDDSGRTIVPFAASTAMGARFSFNKGDYVALNGGSEKELKKKFNTPTLLQHGWLLNGLLH